MDGLAFTLGVAFILQNLLLLGATATYRVIPGGYWLRTVALGPVILSRVTLVAAGAAAAALVGLDLWLRVSWTGSGLRAVSQSRPAAASLGISPARMERVAFLAGGAIAAAAGGLVLLTRFLTPGEGPAWTLVALAVAFLGGRPQARSAHGGGSRARRRGVPRHGARGRRVARGRGERVGPPLASRPRENSPRRCVRGRASSSSGRSSSRPQASSPRRRAGTVSTSSPSDFSTPFSRRAGAGCGRPGFFRFGQAAFFGAGALTQAWLVTAERISPWLALCASAAAGALAALPLIPALRLRPASFGLATLSYAVLLKGLAGSVLAFGMEGFLLPTAPGFDGAAPAVVATLGALALASSLGYEAFLRRPSGRAAAAIRQSPATTLEPRHRPRRRALASADPERRRHRTLGSPLRPPDRERRDDRRLLTRPSRFCRSSSECSGAPSTRWAESSERSLLYPFDEMLLRPALPQAHLLAYGLVLCGLLMVRPEGILRQRVPADPAVRRHRGADDRSPSLWPSEDVTVRRGGTPVLRNVSFAVEPGEILRVVGSNGAGKTSLLLAIAGGIPIARGAILFGGAPSPRGAAARARRGVGRSFQAPRPFPEWTVRENVALAAERGGTRVDVDRLLSELRLASLKDRPAGQLSVGEGKRLELARVLAADPALLLLDEPLAGLSPEAAEHVSGLIDRARRQGRRRRLGRARPGRGEARGPASRPRGGADPIPRIGRGMGSGASGAVVVNARLETRDLTGGYPGVSVFSDVGFSVAPGRGPDDPGGQRLRKVRASRDPAGPSSTRAAGPSSWTASPCRIFRRRSGPRAE